MMIEFPYVKIPLSEYREMVEELTRYRLLEEQAKKREEEMQQWLEKAKAEQKKGEEQC